MNSRLRVAYNLITINPREICNSWNLSAVRRRFFFFLNFILVFNKNKKGEKKRQDKDELPAKWIADGHERCRPPNAHMAGFFPPLPNNPARDVILIEIKTIGSPVRAPRETQFRIQEFIFIWFWNFCTAGLFLSVKDHLAAETSRLADAGQLFILFFCLPKEKLTWH